ncbi:MAG TPA: hypothetical protein VGD98_07150, partial [Ktedonobacteraceae bacterium]
EEKARYGEVQARSRLHFSISRFFFSRMRKSLLEMREEEGYTNWERGSCLKRQFDVTVSEPAHRYVNELI